MKLSARDATALVRVTDHAEARMAETYGTGEVAGKIQAHVIVARG